MTTTDIIKYHCNQQKRKQVWQRNKENKKFWEELIAYIP
jgi:hypothetical protein